MGCSTEPKIQARVRVTAPSITAELFVPGTDETGAVRFTIPFRVENFGAEPVMFGSCPAGSVEVLDPTGWREVWGGGSGFCPASVDPLISIPAGESRDFQRVVDARLDLARDGWRNDRVEGVYRYVLTVHAPEDDRLPSNGFRLTVTP